MFKRNIRIEVVWPCWLTGHEWECARYGLIDSASGGAMSPPTTALSPAEAYKLKPEGMDLIRIERCPKCNQTRVFNVGPNGELTDA